MELRQLAKVVLNLVYPPRCVVCGEALHRSLICARCNPRLTLRSTDRLWVEQKVAEFDEKGLICNACGEEHDGNAIDSTRCLPCFLFPLGTRYTRSLWRYTGAVESIIRSFKYRRGHALAEFLSGACVEAIPELFPAPHWDFIIPVPSVRRTVRRRGYSPTAIIARGIGRQLGIPVNISALRSIGDHTSQTGLSPIERRKNVENSFTIGENLTGKTILLIDDVITSGSTVTAATRKLIESGVSVCDALTIARSLHFRDKRIQAHRVDRHAEEKCQTRAGKTFHH